tara:strand:+ start:3157 stop:3708 length:552 start_codon:yes stop_codon:yes gene_type:complete
MRPRFQANLSIPVRNHLTGEEYLLKRIDEVGLDPERRKQIASICNEPRVYSWLFRDLLQNAPYTEEKAISFFEMGRDGWRKGEKFVFLLLRRNGDVAAAIDIKSNDPDDAEIGYWSSESHRGCMTNTTIELVSLAESAGYRALFARTKKANKDSIGVLQRAGFQFDSKNSKADDLYDFYRIRF